MNITHRMEDYEISAELQITIFVKHHDKKQRGEMLLKQLNDSMNKMIELMKIEYGEQSVTQEVSTIETEVKSDEVVKKTRKSTKTNQEVKEIDVEAEQHILVQKTKEELYKLAISKSTADGNNVAKIKDIFSANNITKVDDVQTVELGKKIIDEISKL